MTHSTSAVAAVLLSATVYMLLLLAMPGSATATIDKSVPPYNDPLIWKMISQMTLEEKIGQMTQLDMSQVVKGSDTAENAVTVDPDKLHTVITQFHVGSFLNSPAGTTPVPGLPTLSVADWQGILTPIQDRSLDANIGSETTNAAGLRIPAIFGLDSVHGGNYITNATIFPQQINMGATFSPHLTLGFGFVQAKDTRACGIPWAFSPILGIALSAQWPRVFETFGEDPLVASTLGRAAVLGQQGGPELVRKVLNHLDTPLDSILLGLERKEQDEIEAQVLRLHERLQRHEKRRRAHAAHVKNSRTSQDGSSQEQSKPKQGAMDRYWPTEDRTEFDFACQRHLASPLAVAATMKHFIGYSIPRSGHDRSPSWLPDRQLYEYFLPSFRAANRGCVATAMESYNEINGVPVAASHRMLGQLLREDMGFTGTVVTDWAELRNLHLWHHLVPSIKAGVELAMQETTIDMSMVPLDLSFVHNMVELVQEGKVPMERLDRSVYHVLDLKKKLGLFQNPYPPKLDSAHVQSVGSKADRMLALQIARESIVLLENPDAFLPLSFSMLEQTTTTTTTTTSAPSSTDNNNNNNNNNGDANNDGNGDNASTSTDTTATTVTTSNHRAMKMLFVGPSCDSITYQTGGWSIHWQGAQSDADFPYGSSILTAVKEMMRRHGPGDLTPQQVDATITYMPVVDADGNFNPDDLETAVRRAQAADVVVACIGEKAYAEKPGDIQDLGLPWGQQNLVAQMVQSMTPTVVLLVEGRPRVLSNTPLAQCAAVLWVGLPGPQGGQAVAEILFGMVSPSGRLPLSYPQHINDIVVEYFHKPSEMQSFAPQWVFGRGLSYRKFEYEPVELRGNAWTPTDTSIDKSSDKSSDKMGSVRADAATTRGCGEGCASGEPAPIPDQYFVSTPSTTDGAGVDPVNGQSLAVSSAPPDAYLPREGDVVLRDDGNPIEVVVRVTNSDWVQANTPASSHKHGSTASEAVLMFVSAQFRSITPEIARLRKFAKVTLRAGEGATVRFLIYPEDLAFYDVDMQLSVSTGRHFVQVADQWVSFWVQGPFTHLNPHRGPHGNGRVPVVTHFVRYDWTDSEGSPNTDTDVTTDVSSTAPNAGDDANGGGNGTSGDRLAATSELTTAYTTMLDEIIAELPEHTQTPHTVAGVVGVNEYLSSSETANNDGSFAGVAVLLVLVCVVGGFALHRWSEWKHGEHINVGYGENERLL